MPTQIEATEIDTSPDTQSTKIEEAAGSPHPHLTLITREHYLGAPTEPPAWYYVLHNGILSECSWPYIICLEPGCTKTKIQGKWVEQSDYPRGPHMPIVTGCCEQHPFINRGPQSR